MRFIIKSRKVSDAFVQLNKKHFTTFFALKSFCVMYELVSLSSATDFDGLYYMYI